MNFKLWIAAVVILVSYSLASAQITGTVKLDGKPPEMREIDMSGSPACANMHADPVFEETVIANLDTGALKNVVVSIKHDDPKTPLGDGHKLADTVMLSQKGCIYAPHVVAMMIGQPMKVRNEDQCSHNVHSLSEINEPFNFAQQTKDDGKDVPAPEAPETYPVKCDTHTWMTAWVCVFDHPYFAITKDDGSYSIDTKGLADGQYTLIFWHEKYLTQEVKIAVKDHKATADAVYKVDSPDAK